MKFTELRKIDVSKQIEKKNNLSYLSWAWAVDQLLQHDPTATWDYKPHQLWGSTVMVFCTVKAFGVERTAQLPVMDHRNKAISEPDAFQVNTAMQRCLAKAIALHGIGLYIYAGEDLPEGAEEPEDDLKQDFDKDLEKIAKASKDTLRQEFSDAVKKYKNSVEKIKLIEAAKDKRKLELKL